MITDGILNALTNVFVTLISALPAWEPPAYFGTVLGLWADVMADTQTLARWFPLPMISYVGISVFSAVVISVTIRLTRIVISLFTAGGGSVQ